MNQSGKLSAGLLLSGVIAGLTPDSAKAQKLERPDALRLKENEVSRLKLRRGDTASEHYPPQAKRDAVDGIVLVDLLLNIEGQVLEAQVISESPRGFGFGIAALDTAKTFEFVNPFKRQVLLSKQIAFLP